MSFGMNGDQGFNKSFPARGSAGIPGKNIDRKLFIGGLTRQTTEDELRDYFGKYGGIESVTVKIDQYTGQSRGFAFIVFSDAKSIDEVLSSDHYINNRKVDLGRAKAQPGKIFVGGLTQDITDEDLRSHFSQYGTIVEIQTPFDKVKNQRKGFCFITFENKSVVYQVLKSPKQCIKGKEVDVKNVKSKSEDMSMNPGALMPTPDMSGWGMNSPPDYASYYGAAAYSNYEEEEEEYRAPYGNSRYGYPNAGPNHPYAPYSRGPGQQFQRHQRTKTADHSGFQANY